MAQNLAQGAQRRQRLAPPELKADVRAPGPPSGVVQHRKEGRIGHEGIRPDLIGGDPGPFQHLGQADAELLQKAGQGHQRRRAMNGCG